jgi:hypothetical protein
MAIGTDRLTTFRVARGYIGVDKFCTFTYVDQCGKERCPAFEICTYEKKGPCLAKKGYLLAAYGPMERLMRKAKDPGIISHWVGQLLSAYLKLAKFELKEMSLRDPVYTTNKGDFKGHPIYEMIQKQQKLIVELWVKSGLMDMAKKAGLMDTNTLAPSMNDIVQQQNGQAGYYDAMLSAAGLADDGVDGDEIDGNDEI